MLLNMPTMWFFSARISLNVPFAGTNVDLAMIKEKDIAARAITSPLFD
jgi:hypothetical protein